MAIWLRGTNFHRCSFSCNDSNQGFSASCDLNVPSWEAQAKINTLKRRQQVAHMNTQKATCRSFRKHQTVHTWYWFRVLQKRAHFGYGLQCQLVRASDDCAYGHTVGRETGVCSSFQWELYYDMYVPYSCGCYVILLFSFLPPRSVGESHFNHMPQWCVHCQWSMLLTAVFCLLATGNAWYITGGSEFCILTPSNMWCSCGYVLLFSPSSHLSRWVPLFTTCPNGMCSVNDPCHWLPCFVSSLLACMKRNR